MRILLLALFIFLFHFAFTTSTLQPALLRTENLRNPLGIDNPFPRFSWNFESTHRNRIQTAFEIIVSEEEAKIKIHQGDQWNSGIIKSSQSIQIAYSGTPLRAAVRYYWAVRVYDNDGNASSWSAVNFFETGLLNEHDWKGKWIGDGRKQFEQDEQFYQDDPMPVFRKFFTSSKKISTARLYISGLGYYEAFFNGKKIGDHALDPGFTTYRKEVFYSTYDVTAIIKKGKNILGVELANGWYNPLPLRLFGRFNLRNVLQTGRPCVLAQLMISYADGTSEVIATDETWQTNTGAVLRNNVYLGEKYDARLEKKWTMSDSDPSWTNAVAVEGPSGKLISQLLPPIRITRIVRPVSVKKTGMDTFIVDMGQNFAGVARIKVSGPAGTKISLRYGEALHPDGRLNYLTSVAGQIKEIWRLDGGPGAPKTAWQQDEYILKGKGEENWFPRFTFHGFRYVEISGWPGVPDLLAIEGLRMNTDVAETGTFSCSNEMLNKLQETVKWTFLSNLFSVQSDCPAREKMGYGADIVVTAEAFSFNFDMSAFYAKTVRDFANEQQPDGAITEVAPYTGIADRGYGGESGPLGWQLVYPFLQKHLYDFYADDKIIRDQYNGVKKQLEFLRSRAVNQLFYWDISDHEALDTKPEALTASAFYYHHALLASFFAGKLNFKEDSLAFNHLAENIKHAIIQQFYVSHTGRFDNSTQSAQLFSLWYNFTPEIQLSKEVLLQEFKRHNWHLSTGIFSTKMLFDVLSREEMNEIAYMIANQRDFPGWGNMIKNGATTLWESWAQSENTYSKNHPMFGSISEWFYRSLGGINSLSPGFGRILIRPQPAGDLQWVNTTYQSIRGKIVTAWRRNGKSFQLQIEIPPNTTAEINMPSKADGPVTENGIPVSKIKEADNFHFKNGYAVFSIGSGRYTFQSMLN
ncbi:MAG TPA: family 78 glycoside hydrolase catalytic domain [Flavitalea sp.]|nr:family 78 glycoside hydrolase catalytic domain [Flavitalea sp.]